jgi:ribonuclease HI
MYILQYYKYSEDTNYRRLDCKNKTPSGRYNRKQFEFLGIQYPPKKGWKEKIIGSELSEEKLKDFENVSKGLLEGQRTIFQFINKKEPEKIISNSENDTQKEKEIRLINIANISKYNIDYFVYTDGACLNNGSTNAIAGIGIYFGENNPKNVSKKVVGKQTNNIAELQAIIDVFDIIKDDIDNDKKICIVSDSKYALGCVTEYGEKQFIYNWKKDIPNKELVKYGYELYKNQKNVYFMYIKAHTENNDVHSKGNNGADILANKAIGLEQCQYISNSIEKIYLDVPFSKKEEIKKMGGRWDMELKKWYIFDNNENIMHILDNFSNN